MWIWIEYSIKIQSNLIKTNYKFQVDSIALAYCHRLKFVYVSHTLSSSTIQKEAFQIVWPTWGQKFLVDGKKISLPNLFHFVRFSSNYSTASNYFFSRWADFKTIFWQLLLSFFCLFSFSSYLSTVSKLL